MRLWPLAILLLAGCQTTSTLKPQARRDPPKFTSDKERILGVWRSMSADGFDVLIFSRGGFEDGTYIDRWSNHDYRHGYIEERGTWTLKDHQLSFNPTKIKNCPVPGHPEQVSEYKAYYKIADEGAWKPASTTITFPNDNLMVRKAYDSDQAQTLERASAPRNPRPNDASRLFSLE